MTYILLISTEIKHCAILNMLTELKDHVIVEKVYWLKFSDDTDQKGDLH